MPTLFRHFDAIIDVLFHFRLRHFHADYLSLFIIDFHAISLLPSFDHFLSPFSLPLSQTLLLFFHFHFHFSHLFSFISSPLMIRLFSSFHYAIADIAAIFHAFRRFHAFRHLMPFHFIFLSPLADDSLIFSFDAFLHFRYFDYFSPLFSLLLLFRRFSDAAFRYYFHFISLIVDIRRFH
jgi:hypothetical protein